MLNNPIIPPAAKAAIEYQARGWRAIRLHALNEQGLCTCKDGMKPGHERHAGKHPTDTGWQAAPAMTTEEIAKAWSGWRSGCNVGIATGAASGFWVLDIDPDNGGDEGIRLLQETYGPLPRTVMQRTGSGGWHMLFKMPEDFEPTNRDSGLKPFPGLDVRGTGGQIVVWPSVSAKGEYAWRQPDEWRAEPAEAPAWLLDLLRPKATPPPAAPATLAAPQEITDDEQRRLAKYTETVREREVARLKALHPQPADRDRNGYRGDPWTSTVFQVSAALVELANSSWTPYSRENAYADVYAAAPRDDGFTDADVNKHFQGAVVKVGAQARAYPQARQSADSIMEDWFGTSTPTPGAPAAPPKAWPVRPQNDIGNAMRLVDHFGDRVRYLPDAGKWATYADGVWTLHNGTSEVQTLVQVMFTGMVQATEAKQYSENVDPNDTKGRTYREIFLAWLQGQGMDGRISGCLKQAQGRTELRAAMTDFDQDPLLFNVANGVVDLRTGTLLPHDPALLLMRQSPVAYHAEAQAPIWHGFLNRVQPDVEVQEYLQRMLGYALTGSTREQCFFVWTGEGANGKSVAATAVQAILGGYSGTVAPTVLLESREEQHPTGWAAMAGKRFLAAQETSPGKRLDESKLKEFTGGQAVSARFMGRDFFEFVPVGKIFLITNHLPILSADNSIWRRTHLVRWDVTIPEAERDEGLQDKLATEQEGILAWLVAGCVAWQQRKMEKPAVAQKHLADWRGDSDSFAEFLETCTVPAPGARTATSVLYDAYQAWAFRQGIRKPMVQQSFVQAMVERKYVRYRDSRGRGFKDVVAVAPAVALPWDSEQKVSA